MYTTHINNVVYLVNIILMWQITELKSSRLLSADKIYLLYIKVKLDTSFIH